MVALDYLQGLAWVLGYYHGPCPDWSWSYPHELQPPRIAALTRVAERANLQEAIYGRHGLNKAKATAPLPPLHHLSAVLPPRSFKGLLPEPLAQALRQPEWRHWFPRNVGEPWVVFVANGNCGKRSCCLLLIMHRPIICAYLGLVLSGSILGSMFILTQRTKPPAGNGARASTRRSPGTPGTGGDSSEPFRDTLGVVAAGRRGLG